jgi:hypothetical protein
MHALRHAVHAVPHGGSQRCPTKCSCITNVHVTSLSARQSHAIWVCAAPARVLIRQCALTVCRLRASTRMAAWSAMQGRCAVQTPAARSLPGAPQAHAGLQGHEACSARNQHSCPYSSTALIDGIHHLYLLGAAAGAPSVPEGPSTPACCTRSEIAFSSSSRRPPISSTAIACTVAHGTPAGCHATSGCTGRTVWTSVTT